MGAWVSNHPWSCMGCIHPRLEGMSYYILLFYVDVIIYPHPNLNVGLVNLC